MGTGSHVIWNGKPLSNVKNGSWAQGEVKPLRKRGLKVQSPISGTWVTHIWPRYGFDMVLIWHIKQKAFISWKENILM